MVNQHYTTFKGVSSIGSTMLIGELENNLKSYLDWGLLNIGGFVNVRRPTVSTVDGGGFHILRPSSDPAYSAGTVYESIRKDWVWETGVSYNGYSPIAISGVYINNTFFAPNDATYGHYYDYPNGRVIFTGTIPAASSVSLDYSYRLVQVYKAEEAAWFYNGQYASFLPNDRQWTTDAPSSGNFATPPNMRAQFPSIVIECVPRAKNEPFEMGNSSLWVYQDVLFNIVGETKASRDRLIDIFRFEDDHVIALYDSDTIAHTGGFALDYRGMLVNLSGMYPNLVDSYRFTTAKITKFNPSSVESLSPYLWEAKVRWTMELILNNV